MKPAKSVHESLRYLMKLSDCKRKTLGDNITHSSDFGYYAPKAAGADQHDKSCPPTIVQISDSERDKGRD